MYWCAGCQREIGEQKCPYCGCFAEYDICRYCSNFDGSECDLGHQCVNGSDYVRAEDEEDY